MAVLNKRAVVSAIEMYGVSAIRLPMVLGESFNQIIKSLFSNNEQGFFYDPNDLSTMFQDSAGTVPVTGAGQPVGLIRDKSGRNNHAYQTTSASRPILRKNAITGAYYLEFDGSDDFLRTANIDFTATDEVSLFAGVRKLSDVVYGQIAELGVDWFTNNGTFALSAPFGANATNAAFVSRGTTAVSRIVTNIVAPSSIVLVGIGDISGGACKLGINGTYGTSNASQGTGNYGNYPLYIGRRGGTSLPFNGHIYGLIGVGKLASNGETAAIEKELAKRTGVTLNV